MKISELIAELEKIEEENGDIEVEIVSRREWTTYSIDTCHFFLCGGTRKTLLVLDGDCGK